MRKKLFYYIVLACLPTLLWAADKHTATLTATPDSSLADILRKAREMRRLGQADSVTISLAAGTYRLYEPFVVRPEDSHLCLQGQDAVLCGSVQIKGWRKEGKCYVADVPDFNGRPFQFRQLWVNGRRALKAQDVQDLEKMNRIRWVDKKQRLLWVPAASVRALLSGKKDKAGNSLLRSDCRYAELTLHQMWEVSFLRIKHIRLQGDSAAISFHDPEAKIQFERPWPSPMYNTEHNSPYYICNALPLLDTPGEWYHDIRAGKLYYMPLRGENMGTAVVEAPALETLVRFAGTADNPVRGIRLDGITFSYATWLRPSFCGHVPLQAGMYITEGYKLRPSIDRINNHKLDNQDWLGRPSAAVEASYARQLVFDGCRFLHLGGNGLDLVEGCKDAAVVNGRFEDISLNGMVGGSFSPAGLETHKPYQPQDLREVCGGLHIVNNEFADVTNEEWGTCAISLGYVYGANIDHNYIHDVSYSAISMGWGWHRDLGVMHGNRIHANLIERYAAHVYDCAGIYTLGNQPNSVIYENVVRDILKPSYVHDPNHWFYLYTDEGSSNILLKDNWTPTDKYLKNAVGPNNVWTGNGPDVKQEIVDQAGLLKNGKAKVYFGVPAMPKE